MIGIEITINLLLFALLIVLTGFFVATEFAIIRVRQSRINQLVEEGNKRALAAQTVTSNLDEYLSACQLGITITALGLGWLGEPTVEAILHPLFQRFEVDSSVSSVLSFVIAFSAVTFLHVVVGELAPKTVAIQKAEWITLMFSPLIILFDKVMYPFIKALNGSARALVGLFGLKPASEHEMAHSEEELRIILSESFKSGEINQSEYKYVDRIFEFDERVAREIMVPRTDMITLSKELTWNEITSIIEIEKYTRYPVDDGDKDNILGMVNMKELLSYYLNRNSDRSRPLEEFVKPVIRVIETIPVHDLLLKMQKERIHMAVLMDEYGGTSGLVTVEDILEEIVGEIQDEFDTDEQPEIQKMGEFHYMLNARLLISEVNDLLGTELSDEEVDTLGGWILSENIDVKIGDIIEQEGYSFIIRDAEGHHIHTVEVQKAEQQEAED